MLSIDGKLYPYDNHSEKLQEDIKEKPAVTAEIVGETTKKIVEMDIKKEILNFFEDPFKKGEAVPIIKAQKNFKQLIPKLLEKLSSEERQSLIEETLNFEKTHKFFVLNFVDPFFVNGSEKDKQNNNYLLALLKFFLQVKNGNQDKVSAIYRLTLAKILSLKNLDINHRNNSGETALSLALQLKDPNLLTLLTTQKKIEIPPNTQQQVKELLAQRKRNDTFILKDVISIQA